MLVWAGTAAAAGIACWGGLSAVRPGWRNLRGHELLLLVSLGPWALTAWAIALLVVFPERGPSFYRVALFAPIVPGVLAAVRYSRARVELDRFDVLAAAPLAALWLLLVWMAARAPLVQNDPLEYATLARMFFERASLGFYPIAVADPASGFYMPSSHPPTYPLMLLTGHWLQGSAGDFAAARMVAPWLLGSLALVLAAGVRQEGARRGWWIPALAVMAMPLLLRGSMYDHIDAARLQPVAVASVAALVWGRDPARAWVAGLALAAVMAIHSLGLVAAGLVGLFWFALAASGRLTVPWLMRATAIGGLLGGLYYLRNLLQFGVLFKDSTPIWEMANIDLHAHLMATRGLVSTADRLLNGWLAPFTAVDLFGWLVWLVPIAVFAGMRRRRHLDLVMAAVLAIAGWFLLSGGLLAAGSLQAIKNPRYALAIVPFAALALLPLAAFGSRPLRWRDFAQLAVVGMVLALPLQPYLLRYLPGLGPRSGPAPEVARRLPPPPQLPDLHAMPAVLHMNQVVPDQDLVLSFARAEHGYHGRARMLFHLDPRMMSVYEAPTGLAAYDALRGLGVRWVLLPEAPFETVYQTSLSDMLGDPRLVRTVFAEHETRLIEVLPEPRPIEPGTSRTLGPWYGVDQPTAAAIMQPQLVDGPAVLRAAVSEAYLQTGPGSWGEPSPDDLVPSGVHQVEWTIAGRGSVKLELVTYGEAGLLRTPLWSAASVDGRPRVGRAVVEVPATAHGARLRLVAAPGSAWSVQDWRAIEWIDRSAGAGSDP